MRFLTVLLAVVLSSQVKAQEINVTVSGMIFNTEEDSVYIAQFFGESYNDYFGQKLNEDGTFEISGNLPNPDYYVLRFGDQHVNLILRPNSDIEVYSDGNNVTQYTNIIGSDESNKMKEFLQVESEWRLKIDQANKTLKEDPSQAAVVNKQMKAAYNIFQGQRNSFIQRNPNSAALLPVLTTIDYKTDYKTYEAVIMQLVNGFGDSPTVQEIKTNYAKIREERIKNDPLAEGKIAPDFTELTIDGDSLSLSDLRGQVVLLDFWASWCGPCRRENPNVVNVYNKYKDAGFTVMSVSLDQDGTKWRAAIEKDGLIWPNHVSDLGGWKSRVPKIYGVGSIPFTILIDAEGKIIAKGPATRGPNLEKELSKIYGF